MRLLSRLLVAALAVSLAPSLLAIPIPLESTGIGVTYDAVRGADIDPSWIITQITNPNPPGGVPVDCPPASPCAAAVVDIPTTANPPGWVANDANSRWVWVNPAARPTAFTGDTLTVLIETSFNLPLDVDLATVSIGFRLASDDAVTAVRVNGTLVPGLTFAGFGSLSSLATITPGSFLGPNPFVTGSNTIEFTVVDNGSFGGFRVEIDGNTTQYAGVPEPGSLAMVLGGLMVAGFAVRRRRA